MGVRHRYYIMRGGDIVPTDGNPRFALRLEPKVVECLKTLAQEQGRSVSEIVRDVILELLDRNGIDYKTK